MQELVLYYSYTGNSKRQAELYARENDLTLCEIRTQKPINKLQAYFVGCPKAIRGGQTAIETPACSLTSCERVHVFAPVWAGAIAPPMNSALAMLPKGAKVSLHMISGGGTSNQDKVVARLTEQGLDVVGYEDFRS